MACERNSILGLFGYGYDADVGGFGGICRLTAATPGIINTIIKIDNRYISNADGHGWLTVKHDSNSRGDQAGSTYPPLPQYLKVQVYQVKGGREFFEILEGKLKGKTASVKLKKDGSSYLNKNTPSFNSGARLKFNRKTKKLYYSGNIEIDAFTQEYDQLPSNPLNKVPLGIWKIEIPYEIHPIGDGYYKYSKYATTWFHIVTSISDTYQDRFLHPGTISHGCVTVGINRFKNTSFNWSDAAVIRSLNNWDKLYDLLIVSRLDAYTVGSIEVVE